MTSIVRLLAVLGRINPAIWDWIVPMGPIREGRIAGFSVADEVALNPQPIPPGHELLVGSALVAHQIANAAIAAEAAGEKAAGRIVARAVDDWCGTKPRPWPIPWPGPWPFPWPGPDPDPDPVWNVAHSRVVGALTLAAVASRLAEGPARTALSEGAEKLLETGLGG
jgi:hypothetical protein